MLTNDTLIINLGLVNFSVAGILTLYRGGCPDGIARRMAWILFGLGAIATTWGLWLRLGTTDGWWPHREHIAVCLLAWLGIACGFLLRIRGAAGYLAPLAAVMLAAHFFGSDAWHEAIGFHVAGALMGQIWALGACTTASLFLWQQKLLKERRFGQISRRMPALDDLSALMLCLLWSGFVFLTAALISGAAAYWFFGDQGRPVPTTKIAWALSVWLWYLVILVTRNILNHSLKRMAQMSVLGAVLLISAFFGYSFFQPPQG